MPASTLAKACRPPSAAEAIDFVHLSRITMGDKALERDVLMAFLSQIAPLSVQLQDEAARARATHRLLGAARTVGATPLVEALASLDGEAGLARVVARLGEAERLARDVLR